MNLIVRYGPAPGDTEDTAGRLHSTFTGFFIIPLSPKDAQRFFGTNGSDGEDPDPFVGLVRRIWARIADTDTPEGGHILVGAYSSFEYSIGGPPACGFQLGATAGGAPFAPKDYVPLYAVARAKRPAHARVDAPAYIDFAVDYRGVTSPDAAAVSPSVFAVACGDD